MMTSVSPVRLAAPATPTAIKPVETKQRASKLTEALPERKQVEVYDMSSGTEVPVTNYQSAATKDPVMQQALVNAKQVDTFMRSKLKRDGWDGKGAPLKVVVHTPDVDGSKLNNAYWDGRKVYLGDGDGKIFAPLGGSADVLMHETTHAIVDSEVNLRYQGQQGALNESFSDVLATWMDKDDWNIGEDVYTPGRAGDSIRDLSKPSIGHLKQIPDMAVGVHELSGIPSLAAVRAAEKIGRDKMGSIWYRALTDHLDSRAGFAGAARATLEAARDLYGESSSEFAAVADAWKSVGVRSRWKP